MSFKDLRITPRRLSRLRKLDILFARGGYSHQELAAMFGVSENVIETDREFIRDHWWIDRERERSREKRQIRIRELEYIKRLALESYDRSRKDVTETSTHFEDVPCEECEGTGKSAFGVCISCEGRKFNTVERTLTEVKGKPGDAQFLNTAISVVREICKLEALYEQPVQLVKHDISGNVNVNSLSFKDADPELVFQARAALIKLEQKRLEDMKKESEASFVIDGRVNEDKGD